jgi:hypothetical protein
VGCAIHPWATEKVTVKYHLNVARVTCRHDVQNGLQLFGIQLVSLAAGVSGQDLYHRHERLSRCQTYARQTRGRCQRFLGNHGFGKKCDPPLEIEGGKIVGGFARSQVLVLADKAVAAVKAGTIRRFVVMTRCAKYRYNKLNSGDVYSL